MAQPAATELKLLERFRENIRDVTLDEKQQTDMHLLSWIRARDNNLRKAEDMLRKSLEWRIKVDLMNIFNWKAPSYYSRAFRCDICGSDIEGRLVFYLPLGTWDIRKAVMAGEREIYIRYVDQVVARLNEAVLQEQTKLGNHHTQFVAIVDIKDLSLRQVMSPATLETMLETFRRFEANYPETVYKVFVLNATRIFPFMFALVKPILSQTTQNKIIIFNSNKAKWKPVLLGSMSEETLESAFNESMSSSTEKYSCESHKNDEQLIENCVDAGGKLEIKFHVKTAGSILHWEFETVDYDIGFSVLYESNETYLYKRWNSHLSKVEGFHVCQNSGKYTVLFDNSYSRLRSKIVRYLVILVGDDLGNGALAAQQNFNGSPQGE